MITKIMALWEFRGLTPYVRAGLVPAPCGAITRVARTPRNPEDPKLSHGLGLLGMKERMERLGGSLSVISWVNEGTTLIIRVTI